MYLLCTILSLFFLVISIEAFIDLYANTFEWARSIWFLSIGLFGFLAIYSIIKGIKASGKNKE